MEEELREDDEQLLDYTTQKEASLFVIDVSKSMLDSDGDTKQNTVKHALDCAYHFLKYKIIANPSDMVGILLYGTQQTQCPQSYGYTSCENVYLLVDMDCPDAPSMKALKMMLEDEDKFKAVCAPAAQAPSLTNVLFLVNGIFSQKAPNFNYKRILLITDEDDPHKDNKIARQSTITRARDLNDLGVKIEPIFVSSISKPFQSRKFYDEIVFRDDDEVDENLDLLQEGEQRFKQMMNRIVAKASPKRAIFSIPLEIGPGLQIGVKGYILFKEQKISKSTYVYNLGESPQFAKPETTNICVDTSKPLEKTEIRRGFKFGADRVAFADDEIKSIKYFEDPVLRIIGFKSFDKLAFWHNVRPAYFVYPHEATVVGSTRVFAALHKSLLSKQKWALGWFIPRKNANPSMVAMVASKETIAKDSHLQICPPGIFLITLPFADDIRANPLTTIQKAPDELVDRMGDIINNLKLAEYDPLKYQNPALQWHWQTLQALALEEDMPEPKADGTLPQYKAIQKRAGEKINSWHELLDQVKESQLPAADAAPETKKKRPMKDTEAATSKTATKKAKIDAGQATTVDDLIRAIEEDHLEKLTLPVLKQAIKDNPASFKGKPAGTKKADYLDFIRSQLSG